MFAPKSIVIAHLVDPGEKLWGVLEKLDTTGIVMEALNVASFDDWMYQVARKEKSALGLCTVFVPMSRVQRIFLDQDVGEVESYRRRFERHTGTTVESYLGLAAS